MLVRPSSEASNVQRPPRAGDFPRRTHHTAIRRRSPFAACTRPGSLPGRNQFVAQTIGLKKTGPSVRIPQISCLRVGTYENRNGLQGIQERKQLLLLCGTQFAKLSGYVRRLTPMAIDRLLQR